MLKNILAFLAVTSVYVSTHATTYCDYDTECPTGQHCGHGSVGPGRCVRSAGSNSVIQPRLVSLLKGEAILIGGSTQPVQVECK